MRELHHCQVCGHAIDQNERAGQDYCSKACEATVTGLSRSTKLKARIAGTTAWRPLPIEPITNIHSSNPVLILSDIHAPLHSAEWIERALTYAEKRGCTKLIVNGDFIDANTISRHIGGYYRRKSELEDDLSAGESLMKLFADEFKEVYFLSGNHCLERLVKVFRGEVNAQRIWTLFGSYANVKLSSRSFVIVNDQVMVGHPRQYSKIRGSLAQKIAQRYQKSVVLGHLHHSALTVTPCGKYQACEVPCLADLDAFEYTTFEINDMPQPMNGFAIVDGITVQVFDKFSKL